MAAADGNQGAAPQGIRERYARAFQEHGDSPQGVLYHSPGSQTDRFAVLSRVMDYAHRTVLDVGCGLGDLCPYLKSRHGEFSYTGIEVVPETAAVARAKYPDAEIITGSLASLRKGRRFDIVLESGVFNTAEYTFAAMEDVVRAMWDRCRMVCIVNLLSCMSTGTANGDSSYYHPSDVIAMAMRLTRRFSFLHSYRDNDMTLVLFRDEAHLGTDANPLRIPEEMIRRPR